MTTAAAFRPPRSWRGLLGITALTAAYLITAKISLSLGAVDGVAAPVWPPTGLSLAALFIWGPRLWPGVAAGAFLANWTGGVPILVATSIAAGNTLEAIVGTLLLQGSGLRPSLERLRDVLRLVVLGAAVSTAVSATIGAASSWLGGVIGLADFPSAWWTWWIGDAMGDLVVASAVLVWSARRPRGRGAAWWIEAGVFGAALTVVSLLAFRSAWRVPGDQLFGAYFVFPFIIWAAVRFGQLGTATTSVVVSLIAIWSTVNGFGPFARATVHDSLLLLQTFLGIVATTGLLLGAVIAERRRAEAGLRASEARYRRLIDISPDAVTVTAMDGTILLCNEQAAALQGYAPTALPGMNALDLVAAADRSRAADVLRRIRESGSVRTVEYAMLKQDGSSFPAELSASVLLDRAGRPEAFITIWRDISARRQAEATAQRLAAIVESSYDAIIGETLDGAVTSWNAAAEQMYGYSATEMLGRPVSRLAPPEVAAEIPELLARVQEGERIRDHETVRLRKDGTPIPVSLTMSPIRDASGAVIGASIIARDISERREIEQLRSDFIAALTHDIRGPVGSIGNYLELLSGKHGLNPDTQRIVVAMQSIVQTTNALINNYLERARIESGCLSLNKEPLVLNQLLTRIARQHDVASTDRGVAIALELQPELPPIEGDALALERVFANLMHNALKFTPSGGRVTLRTAREADAVAASVVDTGPGIPTEDFPSLFERYQQTAIGRSQLGTGLGLFIAKSLVEAHSGTIRVESNPTGSCFTVVLPLAHGPSA